MRTSHRRCFRAGIASCFLIVLLAPGTVDAAKLQTGDSRHPQSGSSSTSQTSAKSDREEAALLEPGKRIERSLTGVETHRYQLKLQKGQCAVIHVEQRGIDVAVQLLGSDKDPLVEVDDEISKLGMEKLEMVADHDGSYTVQVKPKLKPASGAYEIRLVELRNATGQDRSLYEVQQLRTKIHYLLEADKAQEALPLAQRALTLAQQAPVREDAFVALVMGDLAGVNEQTRQLEEAVQSYARALQILTAKLGADHPQTILAKSRLGAIYAHELEDFPRADQLLSQALDSGERTLGKDDPLLAETLWGLGLFHLDRGEYTSAEAEFLRGLGILERAGATERRQYGQLLSTLGVVGIQQLQYDKARSYLERSLAFRERKFGPDSLEAAKTLNNLGVVAMGTKDFQIAEKYFRRVVEVYEKKLGSENPDYAGRLGNLAWAYSSEGDYHKALELRRRALSICEKNPAWRDLRRVQLRAIAMIYAALEDFDNANKFQAQAETEQENRIALNMEVGSERQKLAFYSSDYMADKTDDTVSLNLQLEPDNPQAVALATTVLLQRKGRVLDAMTDTLGALRKPADAPDQVLLEELKEATTQLARTTLQGPQKQSPEEYREALQELQERKEKLENAISHHNQEFRAQSQAVTLQAVQSLIPADAALVEFVAYRPRDPKAQAYKEWYGNLRYGAYVVHGKAIAKGVDLGDAKTIDALVEKFRAALRDPSRSDAPELAQAVSEKVFRPIQPFVAEDKRLIISPDGQLNLIPFEALLDNQGRYLVERFSTSYLTTGRDLLRMQVPRWSGGVPVLLADPSFGEPKDIRVASAAGPRVKSGGAGAARRSVTTAADFSSLYFAPLKGTRAEARSIQALFPQARVLAGEQASESALQQLNAPRILHIATHGFFLQDTSQNPAGAAGAATAGPENPLLRSGLALSGANRVKDGKGEGILTALEASNLNLWGTKLVTLSACDTGVGEVKNGEGVYGLRRSFFLAGAETLVMSLWPVSDYVTREMMTSYYSGLKHGLGRGEALRQAELAMLKRKGRQHPFYWASFIQSGEWANLDGER